MSRSKEIILLRNYGYSIYELAKIFYPHMEPSRACLRINSILWKYRKRRREEYRETWEYREIDYLPDRHWKDRYEAIEPDLSIESPDMMELKNAGCSHMKKKDT